MVGIGVLFGGIHNNRFKTFHCSRWRFQYAEHVWYNRRSFSNWDLVAYWEKDNAIAQKTYTTFNPINLVESGTRQY
jgi:hypothetical protein